jgi:hypothetical protein
VRLEPCSISRSYNAKNTAAEHARPAAIALAAPTSTIMKSSSAVLVSVTVLCQNDRRRVHALDTIYKCNISVSSLPAEVDVAIGVGDVAGGIRTCECA